MKYRVFNFTSGGKVHFLSVADGHNEIILERNGSCEGSISNFDSNWGNYWFIFCKRNCVDFDYFLKNVFLDYCAYSYNFDSYSDLYKDYNGCRPHYTKEEWTERVRIARERKP